MKPLARVSRAEAVDLVRHCLEQGEVVQGPHFRKSMSDEGMDFADALTVMRSGTIYDEPEVDPKFGEWKYRIEGHEPGGKWLCIVFSFKEVDRAFLITCWTVEARRRR